jgi:hypothetical protein
MTVQELVNLLSRENPEHQVYVHDADTGWLLPAQWGRNDVGRWDVMPPNIVIIHGEYFDEGMIQEFEKEP